MLTRDQITQADLTDWRNLGQGLHARFVVADFSAGARLVSAVAGAGDAVGHHPRVTLGASYVDLKLITEDAVYRDDAGTEHVVEWVTQQDVMEAAVQDQEAVAAMATLRAWAARLPEESAHVQEPDVSSLFAELGQAIRLAEAARVALAAEAAERGLPSSSGPHGSVGGDLKAWVTERSPSWPVGEVARMVRVINGGRTKAHAPVLVGVTSGRVCLAAADVALAEMVKLKPLLNPDAVAGVWECYLMVAETGDLRLIRALRPAMLARFGGAQEFQDRQDDAKRRTGLSFGRPLDDSGGEGLAEYRLVLDAEGRAILEAAIGPLSAPVPGPGGEPDSRTVQRRRADALIATLTRASAAGDKVPSVSRTQLVLTIRADHLAAGTEAGEVLGSLNTGTLLGVETIRKLSCDASLTPVILDEVGNLIHLGRTRRLFSSTQLKALWLRDRHCTYPGCDTPAHWCDAHHILHWADGALTDLDNAALLCGFHHTLVHQRRLTASLTRGEGCGAPVGWDLTPGSYDRARALARERESGNDPPGRAA